MQATATHTAVVLNPVCLAHSRLRGSVSYSYQGTTPVGSLTISDGTNTLLTLGVSGAEDRQIHFDSGLYLTQTTFTMTLADGGSAVVGALSWLPERR